MSWMAPDRTKYSAKELDDFLAANLVGFEPDPAQHLTGDMTSATVHKIAAKGGDCTFAVFRLAAGAAYGKDALPGGVNFQATEVGSTETFDIDPGCHGPGGSRS